MKGRSSFLMKGIYFIIILVIIAIVINQLISLNIRNIQQWESVNLRDKSKNILETLAGNKGCLAYEEVANIEGTEVNLTSHKIIDVNKLNYFANNFSKLEPDCVRDFEYGYRVKVETFPINMKTGILTEYGGVFGKVLNIIDGGKVIFLVDVSDSMRRSGGECVDPNYPDSRICCLKKFMITFIEKMKGGSVISIIRYGHGPCDPDLLFPFTKLEGNIDMMRDNIENLIPMDNTPMCKALEYGFDFALDNGGADSIVLLTDGCENKCCESEETHEVAQRYESDEKAIPVYTIAYGTQACPETLKKTARITDGEYFDARDCEELVGPNLLDITMSSESWSFGDSVFSREDALEESVKVSIPVIVSYNSTISVPGKMTLTLVKGELEELVGFIERTCFTEKSSTASLYLHYPTHLEIEDGKSKVCMTINGKDTCQELACDKEIDFSGNRVPGNYKIYSRLEDGKLKIII